MQTGIFSLQIIPISDILPHEEFDSSRALPLITELNDEGVLVNPVVVANLENGKYLQLDGMNRLSAFHMMGKKTILTQVIDYNDQDSVELASWLHLFHAKKEEFLSILQKIPGITLEKSSLDRVGNRYIKEEGTGRLCTIVFNDLDVELAVASGNLTERVDLLNHIVNCYKNGIIRDVLPISARGDSVNHLFEDHPEANIMIVFPTFTRHQIVHVVKEGKLLPSGITRFLIHRRCLNVNVPMSLFQNGKSLEDQNLELEKILGSQSFRVYEEPTVYFE